MKLEHIHNKIIILLLCLSCFVKGYSQDTLFFNVELPQELIITASDTIFNPNSVLDLTEFYSVNYNWTELSSFSWKPEDNFIHPHSANPNISKLFEGYIYFEVSSYNECFARDSIYLLTSSNYSIDDFSLHVKIFPNPAKDQLSIYWNQFEVCSIEIRDVLGQIIYIVDFIPQGSIGVDFSLLNIPDGHYIVSLKNNNSVFSKKLLICRY